MIFEKINVFHLSVLECFFYSPRAYLGASRSWPGTKHGRAKCIPRNQNRSGKQKHLKAQGTCPHICLLEQIWAIKNLGWFHSQARRRRRRPAGFGEGRPDLGRSELRFSECFFFLCFGHLENKNKYVRGRYGANEICPKVRKIKEGSNNFRELEKKQKQRELRKFISRAEKHLHFRPL